MNEKTVTLTKDERNLILNNIEYLVNGGLTAFPLTLFEEVFNKLRDDDDPLFSEIVME